MDALLLGRGQVPRRSNFTSLAILTVVICRPVYIDCGRSYTTKPSRDEVVSSYHTHSKAYHQGMSSSFSGLCNLGRPLRPFPPTTTTPNSYAEASADDSAVYDMNPLAKKDAHPLRCPGTESRGRIGSGVHWGRILGRVPASRGLRALVRCLCNRATSDHKEGEGGMGGW